MLCCLWHLLSKRESLLSYPSGIFCIVKEGEFTVKNLLWERWLKEGELLSKKEDFFDWHIVLHCKERLAFKFLIWHVVLPSMPKREIVGYNWIIVRLSLMLHKYHISHQTESTKHSRALQRKFSLYQAQKVNVAVYSVYRARKVNKRKVSVHWARKVNERKV